MHQAIADFIVKKILKTPNRVLKMDEPLISRGLIDSLTLVDLSLFVEDAFGVHLKNSDLNAAAFDTVDELVSLIIRRQSKHK